MSKERNFVLKPYEVTDEHLDNILVGAFEGGSNYWAEKVKVKDDDYKGAEFASGVISKGGELYIYTDGDQSVHLLTKNSLINGLQQFINESKRFGHLWPDKGDAGTDDMILQYALFEEVVYG